MSQCRTCHASIVWAVIQSTGKRHPFDVEPGSSGKWRFYDAGGDLMARPVEEPWPGNRYTSHYATCKQADEWRQGQHRR